MNYDIKSSPSYRASHRTWDEQRRYPYRRVVADEITEASGEWLHDILLACEHRTLIHTSRQRTPSRVRCLRCEGK